MGHLSRRRPLAPGRLARPPSTTAPSHLGGIPRRSRALRHRDLHLPRRPASPVTTPPGALVLGQQHRTGDVLTGGGPRDQIRVRRPGLLKHVDAPPAGSRDRGAQRLDVQRGAIEFSHGVEGNAVLFDSSPERETAVSMFVQRTVFIRFRASAAASALQGNAPVEGSTVTPGAARVPRVRAVIRLSAMKPDNATIATSAHTLSSAHSHAVTVGSDSSQYAAIATRAYPQKMPNRPSGLARQTGWRRFHRCHALSATTITTAVLVIPSAAPLQTGPWSEPCFARK